MFGHNFGGIKGGEPDGRSVLAWTRESQGDAEILALRAFRAYSDARQGARDYVRLLERRYPVALRAARAGDPGRFADALVARGYASDDANVYRRALASLSNECLSRSIPSEAIARLAQASPVVSSDDR
jgi:flagellum-specific peptidoglycan hydrolase FlgJ